MEFLKNTDPRFHLVETRVKWFIFLAVAGVVGLIAFVVWKQEFFRPARRVYLVAQSSQGVQKGMAARLSGFRIGKVTGVELEHENRVKITLDIFREYARFVRRDSRAEVRSESLIGDRFIEIRSGTAAMPELQEGETLALEPEKSITTLMESLKDELRPAVTDVREIIAYLNNPDGDLKTTMHHVRELSTTLRDAVPKTLADIRSTAGDGSTLFQRLNKDDESLWKALVSLREVTKELREEVPPLLEKLDTGISAFGEAADSTKQVMADAIAVIGEVDKVVQQAGPEVPKLVKQGTETVKKADDVVTAVKGMWPVSKGVPKEEEQTLKPRTEP